MNRQKPFVGVYGNVFLKIYVRARLSDDIFQHVDCGVFVFVDIYAFPAVHRFSVYAFCAVCETRQFFYPRSVERFSVANGGRVEKDDCAIVFQKMFVENFPPFGGDFKHCGQNDGLVFRHVDMPDVAEGYNVERRRDQIQALAHNVVGLVGKIGAVYIESASGVGDERHFRGVFIFLACVFAPNFVRAFDGSHRFGGFEYSPPHIETPERSAFDRGKAKFAFEGGVCFLLVFCHRQHSACGNADVFREL